MCSIFRLANNSILLTYPHCDYSPNDFLTKLLVTIDINHPTPEIEYICVSREDHHLNDGKHMHVFIKWVSSFKTTNARIFDIEGHHPNIEKVTTTRWKSVKYVKKDGEFVEYKPENCPKPIIENMSKHEKLVFLKENDPIELYDRNEISAEHCMRLMKAKQYIESQRKTKREKPIVLWFWGATGTGKTRTAVEIAEQSGHTWWISNDPELKWFDGYCGQDYAIIDDFRRQGIRYNHVLRLTDRYPYQVQIKGGFTTWCPKVIIFTCPADPHDCYSYINKDGDREEWDNLDQFIRRIDDVIEF